MQEKTVKTTFMGYDDVEYDAKITLVKEDGGHIEAMGYSYWNEEKKLWVYTEEVLDQEEIIKMWDNEELT